MIYVVLKPIEDSERKLICLVNATNSDKAKETCGVDTDSKEWAGFSTADIDVINSTKQGYIAETM